MLVFDDARTYCQAKSGDSSAATLSTFDMLMNFSYKDILAELARPTIERTKTASTVANQRNYQTPNDCLFIKSVTVTVGSTTYTLMEEESQEYFNYRTSTTQTGIPSIYFIRPRFGYSGTEVLLDPVPSDVYTLNLVYEATDKDLGIAKYTTGTITVTNNSTTITGAGAASFTSAMIGRVFKITDSTGDGQWYRIANQTSSSVLLLEQSYGGSSTSGSPFQISETFNLPEEMQILPAYFALSEFFDAKKDRSEADRYLIRYTNGIAAGKKRYATKGRGSVIRPKNYTRRWPVYPGYFPQGGVVS